ncbi:MAG: hypothetical protein K9L62_00375 [Vallitaleaceae bacterium]|nr:hypothetical protein [Vallitaleaceae bacterium]
MTIAEKLYMNDPDTLFEIIVRYQLERLARLYFPDNLVATNEDNEREYAKLMQSPNYTGRVERRRGAITQQHREVVK